MLLTVFGCQVEYNDATTGLNPGCNFAGVCVQVSKDISTCVCCAPEEYGNNICRGIWVCDRSSPSFQCLEFSSDDCSKVNQYLLVNLEFLTVNENANKEPDIMCNEWPGLLGQGETLMLSYDVADYFQYVASRQGWSGAIKSRGVCGQCTLEVPCAAGDELITSGITFTFQVDLNLYYDANCAVDFWIYGKVVECDANYDYGQLAWFIWRTAMGDESYINRVNNLLRMDFDEEIGLGRSWSNSKIAAVREELTVITNNNVILTAAPTYSPTAAPTELPTADPTDSPTAAPTDSPTASPTESPTTAPTKSPTSSPSHSPTASPTDSPTTSPSDSPTPSPTESPSAAPTHLPTVAPTQSPSYYPTEFPTSAPSALPTAQPSDAPTIYPTVRPTRFPTRYPTYSPTFLPTKQPTKFPTKSPTDRPTREPTTSATPFYRYYNGGVMDHLYTRDWNELRRGGNGWTYEGTECKLYGSQVPGTVPLYRYFKPIFNGFFNHFYTTNIRAIGTGRAGSIGKFGYQSEGVAGYCYPRPGRGLKPLYRFHHLSAHYENHFYKCGSSSTPGGYGYEGIECYLPK